MAIRRGGVALEDNEAASENRKLNTSTVASVRI